MEQFHIRFGALVKGMPLILAFFKHYVSTILDNKTYLGHMAGLRSSALSYKNKKLIRHPESEQILVETPMSR